MLRGECGLCRRRLAFFQNIYDAKRASRGYWHCLFNLFQLGTQFVHLSCNLWFCIMRRF